MAFITGLLGLAPALAGSVLGEIVDPAYARVAGTIDAAAIGEPLANTTGATFGPATVAWSVAYVLVFDAAGNPRLALPITGGPVAVAIGDRITIAAGALLVTLGGVPAGSFTLPDGTTLTLPDGSTLSSGAA